MDEDYFEDDPGLEQERDHKVDEVKLELMATLFDKSPQSVFYERQIQVLYEDKFFHWITGKALHELSDERSIKTMKLLTARSRIDIGSGKLKGSANWCCAFQHLSLVGRLAIMLKRCSTLHYQLPGSCRKRKISVSTTVASGPSPNMILIVSLSEMPSLTVPR
jgi:hypothetical protein